MVNIKTEICRCRCLFFFKQKNEAYRVFIFEEKKKLKKKKSFLQISNKFFPTLIKIFKKSHEIKCLTIDI